MITRLCPNARIAVGHGQMEGKKLEAIILDFMDGLYDILVATTIIESGIDIPNANTNNKQCQSFPDYDLHQLRGRVGRSNKSICLLFTPPFNIFPLKLERDSCNRTIFRFGKRI